MALKHPAGAKLFLRDGLDHETIKAAIERSLAGGNESARVACVKFLSDLELHRQDSDECPRCAAWKAEAPAARDKVWEMISRYVEHAVRSELGVSHHDERTDSQASRLVRDAVQRGLAGREHDLEVGIQAAVGKVLDRISNGLVVDNVVDADGAAESSKPSRRPASSQDVRRSRSASRNWRRIRSHADYRRSRLPSRSERRLPG